MRRAIVLSVTVFALAMLVPVGGARASTGALPFRATFRGYTTGMEAPTGCPTGSAYKIYNAGWGWATHLGRFTWASVHCTLFGTNPPFSVTLADGHMTYVTANGDVLLTDYAVQYAYVSEFTPTQMCIDNDAVFVGGTGRFEDASGSAHEHGCFDPREVPTGELLIDSLGTIVFDASDRAE
jgi:hypothetical protein